ncbi:hypothetical protein STEG23_033624, partial [Scotinomys teguina]
SINNTVNGKLSYQNILRVLIVTLISFYEAKELLETVNLSVFHRTYEAPYKNVSDVDIEMEPELYSELCKAPFGSISPKLLWTPVA